MEIIEAIEGIIAPLGQDYLLHSEEAFAAMDEGLMWGSIPEGELRAILIGMSWGQKSVEAQAGFLMGIKEAISQKLHPIQKTGT